MAVVDANAVLQISKTLDVHVAVRGIRLQGALELQLVQAIALGLPLRQQIVARLRRRRRVYGLVLRPIAELQARLLVAALDVAVPQRARRARAARAAGAEPQPAGRVHEPAAPEREHLERERQVGVERPDGQPVETINDPRSTHYATVRYLIPVP